MIETMWYRNEITERPEPVSRHLKNGTSCWIWSHTPSQNSRIGGVTA